MRKDISDDLALLPDMQNQMARRALSWLQRDGTLIYATCSLQPEEGEDVITALTTGPRAAARIVPITTQEAGVFAKAITENGCLRLLPDSYEAPATAADEPDNQTGNQTGDQTGNHSGGNDGFFIARLQRI
jgi:16S rRNA (cytosine967-C5)-methyltransferase